MALQSSALAIASQNAPASAYTLVGAGNPYSATAGVSTTLLLGVDVNPQIIHAWNREHVSTAFMLGLKRTPSLDKTPNWMEVGSPNVPIEITATQAIVPNVTTGPVNQAYSISDQSNLAVSVGDKVTFAGATRADGIVVSKAGGPGAYTITVTSAFGKGFPAVAAGELMANAGNQRGDAKATVDSQHTMETIQFSNTMEDMGDIAVRWDPQQSVIWENTGRTNYKEEQLKHAHDRYMSSIEQRIWMSSGGTFTLPNGMRSMATKGLLKQQEDAGVATIDVTPGNVMDILRETVFDIQMSGGDDLVLAGTGRSLDKVGLSEKSERLRYGVGDKVYNMNMTRYEYWGHSITPLRIDSWADAGMYGGHMENQLVLFRKSDIELRFLKNWPMMSMMYKMSNRQNSGSNVTPLADAEIVWWNALFAPEWHKAAFSARFRMNA